VTAIDATLYRHLVMQTESEIAFQILGPLVVVLSDGMKVESLPPKQLAILTLLIVHRGQVMSAERITEEVWGEDAPGTGLKALQYHISKLRDRLEPDRSRGTGGSVVLTRGAGYVVEVPDSRLDAARFEGLLTEALALDASDASPRRAILDTALALWRGRALDAVASMPSTHAEGERLDELRIVALESRIEADLALGQHAAIVAELEVLTNRHPLRERLWGQLMLALYRSGRQAEALRAYQTARTILGEELGVDPSAALRDLEARMLAQDESLDPPVATSRTARTNIPAQVSNFIGRTEAVPTVERLVKEQRLVTLLGPGGVGKTRLAIQVAPALMEQFGDGVILVELGGLSDPAQLPKAVRLALGVSQEAGRSTLEVVCEYLATRSVLIVLDNCEHVIDMSAELVTAMLGAAPRLHVLATSREPLRTPGETTWPVPPLDFPAAGAPVDFENPTEAMSLFVDRARAVNQEFTLNEENAVAVADICRRLDGLPLAIQLAAARSRALSVHDLVARLDDRFALLAGQERGVMAHHQTLEATVAWSYDLLSDAERTLFDCLGVFANSFALEAVEHVASAAGLGRGEAVALLSSLVDKSLVSTTRSPNETRYRMLETVRDYAKLRLLSHPDPAIITRAHTEWVLSFALQANAELMGPGRTLWSARILTTFDDMRAVLERSYNEDDPESGVRLISAMEPFFIEVGDHEGFLTATAAIEGASWLERLTSGGDVTPEVLARVLSVRGFLMMLQGDDAGAATVLKRSIELFELVSDPVGLARAQMYLATSLWSESVAHE